MHMQLFIHFDRTYVLQVSHDLSYPELRRLIKEKTNIPITMQFILHNGRIVNHFRAIEETDIRSGDTLRVLPKLFGGNFVSTGNLVTALTGSLVTYFSAFPIIFYGLDFLTYSTTLTQPSSKYLSLVSNYNMLSEVAAPFVWDKIINGNTSFLLYLYLAIAFTLWFLYSSTMTMLINSYYVCQNNKMSGNQILTWIALFIGYLLMYPAIYAASRWSLVANYSVAIFSLIGLVFIAVYGAMVGNIWSYVLMTVLVLFLYYAILGEKYSGWKLFVLIPMLGSVYYVVNYLMEYFAYFSELC